MEACIYSFHSFRAWDHYRFSISTFTNDCIFRAYWVALSVFRFPNSEKETSLCCHLLRKAENWKALYVLVLWSNFAVIFQKRKGRLEKGNDCQTRFWFSFSGKRKHKQSWKTFFSFCFQTESHNVTKDALLSSAFFVWIFFNVQVSSIAKQFAVLHNALKFDALHLLSAILSSEYSVCNFSSTVCLLFKYIFRSYSTCLLIPYSHLVLVNINCFSGYKVWTILEIGNPLHLECFSPFSFGRAFARW